MPAFLRSFAFGFAFLLAVSNTRADNWERFRGPNGEGISNDKNIPIKFSAKDNVRWKTKIPGDGNGSPIVWGDRIFLQTASLDASERSLLCLDAKTGDIVWTRSIPGKNVKLSRKDTSHASASPTTDGEAVYIPFWNGKDIIMAAYRFDGEKIWQRNLGEFVSQHGAGVSPILYKDLLIFPMDKDAHYDVNKKDKLVPNPSTLYAFDKKTGKTVWETPREAIRACYSMPFILNRPGGKPELLVTSTTAITSYDPLTGKSNWYWTWTFPKGPLRTIAATTYAKDMLLACSGDGDGRRLMVAVKLKGQGEEVRPEAAWFNDKQFPYATCMLSRGDHVFFVNDIGVAGCFHVKTGKEVWFERLPDAKMYASPILINGKMYAASEQGDVYVIDADTTYNLLAKNVIGERIRATPAVADGSMYIRGQYHLYCIGAK